MQTGFDNGWEEGGVGNSLAKAVLQATPLRTETGPAFAEVWLKLAAISPLHPKPAF